MYAKLHGSLFTRRREKDANKRAHDEDGIELRNRNSITIKKEELTVEKGRGAR